MTDQNLHNLKDLKLKTELLPLFDYSLNNFARSKIIEILNQPLGSVAEIKSRQKILQAFAANHSILESYSYTVLYLNEVYVFLNTSKLEDLSKKKLAYKWFASKNKKARYISKFNQLILLFHRLYTKYFVGIDLKKFPKKYQSNINNILQFFAEFELSKYEYIIREERLKDKHIIELTKKINSLKQEKRIVSFWEDLFQFEAYLSISLGIEKNKFTYPNFTTEHIKINELYHPLIDDPVKNDFDSNNNVVVLNGPNMSGKSTFLKAVGICVYFGHLGFAVPASAAEIPFFRNFSIEINRRDDILNGYSHFMTEIMNLKKVVTKASNGEACFAIFDELFSGTNAEDAQEICKTTINGLSKFKNSYFFISTHIQELKNITNEDVSNYYIDCTLKENKPTFTYQLKKGWSDIKVGRILFDKEGLNKMLA
ncbi:MAG: MutS-related protein [Bacteroidota bacterium]